MATHIQNPNCRKLQVELFDGQFGKLGVSMLACGLQEKYESKSGCVHDQEQASY